jgi:hypothetical protein
MTTMASSVFDRFRAEAWPFTFSGTLVVDRMAGGTPSDPKVAEGWLRSKVADKDDNIRSMVATAMSERGIGVEEATAEVDMNQHLNGFKRFRCDDCTPTGAFCKNGQHELFMEGRQLKACIKEACSVAVAAGKLEGRGWGRTNKGLLGFIAEHVMVVEDQLPLGVFEPTGVAQRFVHTFRGNGIQYEEYVEDATIDFTVISDYDFKPRDWAMIWLTAEQQGVGASRGQGFGRFTLTRWEEVSSE